MEGTLILPLQPTQYGVVGSERPYYEYFRAVVVHDLARQLYGIPEFWERTVLREALRDQFIFDAIVAIGGLCQAVKLRRMDCSSVETAPLDSTAYERHYSHALKYHVRALAKYRSLLANEPTSMVMQRRVLIATLLFTVFETIQGNRMGVDTLRAKAILVLADATTRTNNGSTKSQLAGTLDDQGMEDAGFYLTRQGTVSSLLSPLYPQSKRSLNRLHQIYAEAPSPPELSQSLSSFNRVYMHFLTSILLWLNHVVELIASGHPVQTDSLLRMEQTVVISQIKSWLDSIRERLHLLRARRRDKKHDLQDWVILQLMDIGAKVCCVSAITILDTNRDTLATHKYTRDAIDQTRLVMETKLPSPELKSNIRERLCFIMANLVRECRDLNLRSEILHLAMELTDSQTSKDMKAALLGNIALASVEDEYRDETGVLPEAMYHDWTSAWWDATGTVLHVTIRARTAMAHVKPESQLELRLRDYSLN
jgi:hypothetical protein